jgi:hypothetical protein
MNHRLEERGLRVRIIHATSTLSFLLVLLVVGVSLMAWGGRGFPTQPMSFLRGPVGFTEVAVIALVYAAIGSFLVRRLPAHALGWSLMLIGIGVALHLPTSLMVEAALASFRPVPPMLVVAAWILTSAFVPLAVSLIAYLLLILPDGRLPSGRWKVVAIVTIVGFHVLTLATALEPSGLVWFPTLPNPIGIPASMSRVVSGLRILGVCLLVLGIGFASVAMLARYRHGDAMLRRQLSWIAGGSVIWALALGPFVVVRYLVPVSDEVGTLLTTVAAAATLGFPISVLIATTRYHLFGIEAMLGRTLVYVPLMAICGGMYAAALTLSQRLFVAATGNTSDIAIIVATLLMAAAFTPARKALEIGVERLMSARREPAAPGATPANAAEDLTRLTEQAATFSARLAEIEREIAVLEQPQVRDPSRDAGEPGVGRSVVAGAPLPPQPG